MGKLNYVGFAKLGSVYGPAIGNGEYTPTLPAGHYRLTWNEWTDELVATHFVPHLDDILDLGCKEFDTAVSVTKRFLTPEMAKEFARQGYVRKRSFLFFGPPGTGKSVLACKVSDLAVREANALALYPDSYQTLQRMLEVLEDTDPGRFKVIALEEFDSLIGNHDEASWTSLLDGQFQASNRMVVATTNHLEQIPNRLLRPGRFSSIVMIPPLTKDARFNYLLYKGVQHKTATDIVEQTDGFTVDDLKEIIQAHVILGEPLVGVIDSIKATKILGAQGNNAN